MMQQAFDVAGCNLQTAQQLVAEMQGSQAVMALSGLEPDAGGQTTHAPLPALVDVVRLGPPLSSLAFCCARVWLADKLVASE